MEKCKRCKRDIIGECIMSCQNCGAMLCQDCAQTNMNICPYCYFDLEYRD